MWLFIGASKQKIELETPYYIGYLRRRGYAFPSCPASGVGDGATSLRRGYC
jgi:hypothetical protein